jgi:hypothetical protein
MRSSQTEAHREVLLQSVAGDIARDLYELNDPTYGQWWPIYQSLNRHMWNWAPDAYRTKNPQRYQPREPSRLARRAVRW